MFIFLFIVIFSNWFFVGRKQSSYYARLRQKMFFNQKKKKEDLILLMESRFMKILLIDVSWKQHVLIKCFVQWSYFIKFHNLFLIFQNSVPPSICQFDRILKCSCSITIIKSELYYFYLTPTFNLCYFYWVKLLLYLCSTWNKIIHVFIFCRLMKLALHLFITY